MLSDTWLQILFATLFPFYLPTSALEKTQTAAQGHKRKSKLNGAKIRIRRARCDTATSQGWMEEEEEEEAQQGNLAFPSPATTGQTNFKVELCARCPIAPTVGCIL